MQSVDRRTPAIHSESVMPLDNAIDLARDPTVSEVVIATYAYRDAGVLTQASAQASGLRMLTDLGFVVNDEHTKPIHGSFGGRRIGEILRLVRPSPRMGIPAHSS